MRQAVYKSRFRRGGCVCVGPALIHWGSRCCLPTTRIAVASVEMFCCHDVKIEKEEQKHGMLDEFVNSEAINYVHWLQRTLLQVLLTPNGRKQPLSHSPSE